MRLIIADFVWPALFVELRLFSWWAIGSALLVEYFALRWLTKLTFRQCVFADLTMNGASALAGLVVIPLAGILWELGPGLLLFSQLKIRTFNPVTWTATFVMSVLIYAVLESLVLRWAFKQKIDKRLFWGLCVANSVSVAFAFVSLFVFPPESMKENVREPIIVKPVESSAVDEKTPEKVEGKETEEEGESSGK